MRLIALTLSLLCCSSSPAATWTPTEKPQDDADIWIENHVLGHGLLEDCTAKPKPGENDLLLRVARASCSEYIKGVSDALSASRRRLCLPQASTWGQQKAVVLKYLNDHPEKLHQTRFSLTAAALTAAFPCK